MIRSASFSQFGLFIFLRENVYMNSIELQLSYLDFDCTSHINTYFCHFHRLNSVYMKTVMLETVKLASLCHTAILQVVFFTAVYISMVLTLSSK